MAFDALRLRSVIQLFGLASACRQLPSPYIPNWALTVGLRHSISPRHDCLRLDRGARTQGSSQPKTRPISYSKAACNHSTMRDCRVARLTWMVGVSTILGIWVRPSPPFNWHLRTDLMCNHAVGRCSVSWVRIHT